MNKYTFTFQPEFESTFKKIIGRLEPEEYNIIQDIKVVDENNPRYSDREVIIEMNSECALTFRMGMKSLKIRRERTEEELAIEKEREERNKVKIVIQVPEDSAE